MRMNEVPGMAPMQVPGPPRAPGYEGKKKWLVSLEGSGAITIYAPSKTAAIVQAASWFGCRWQDLGYQTRVFARETKQK